MKNVLILLSLFLISCKNSNIKQMEESSEIDSVLIKSQENLIESNLIQKKSDSTTKEQVIKVIKDFKILTNEVMKYKTERVNLMSLQNVTTEKIIYKIDTVYIEVEKNFWGRKKTTTSIKSDSSILKNIDTSSLNNVKIDTLNYQ